MEIGEIIKNIFYFIVVISTIGAIFAGGLIGFFWVLGKFVN